MGDEMEDRGRGRDGAERLFVCVGAKMDGGIFCEERIEELGFSFRAVEGGKVGDGAAELLLEGRGRGGGGGFGKGIDRENFPRRGV